MEVPRPKRNLRNMEIDEVSLVDKGANQHAMVTIAKRATEEENMPDLYSEAGEPVDEDTLEDGDIVFDEEGQAYQFSLNEEGAEEPEMAGVGKSAFFSEEKEKAQTESFSKMLQAELEKAYTDEERDQVIAKAFSRFDELEEKYSKAEEVAKSERDLRLTREYIAKAAEYNLPVDPQDLGPVLYRMAETMSYDDCAVIAKCLETAGEALFQEIGYQGGGDNNDIMSQVEMHAQEIGKSADAETVAGIFDENPEAYEQYLSAQRGL